MRTRDFIRDNANWLGAGALLTFLSSFGQTFFISIFAEHIQNDFELSAGEWGIIYGIGTTVSAVIMVWAGGLTDHFRSRRLGVFVLAGLFLACLLMALNPYAGALAGVVLLLRLFGQGMASHVAMVAMSRWFVATRGRALAICTLGFTAGQLIFPVLFVALMHFVNWRTLWVVAAIISLAGIPPLLLLLRRERHPRTVAETSHATGMQDRHWSRIDVLRHPLFWLLVPALLGPPAFNTAFFFLHVGYAASKGWSHMELVMFFPIYTALSVIAMVASGWAIDRFGTARIFPFYQVPMIASFLFFALGSNTQALFWGFFMMAVTTGANSTIPSAFWAEFFGTRHLGGIKAMAAAVMVLGSAIGPALLGIFLDYGISLDVQYIWVAGYFAFATLFLWIGIRMFRAEAPRYRDLRRYT